MAKIRCGNQKRIWREQTGIVGSAFCERQIAQTRRIEPALSRVLTVSAQQTSVPFVRSFRQEQKCLLQT
ncbi:hypothetical protein BLM14_09815 [Phyllobacterium zundukense]|nr:hypothetical protein BLM14_09815 [Phyllobacterium zundukense]